MDKEYNRYRSLLGSCKRLVSCPTCSVLVVPKDYHQHLRLVHQDERNGRTTCIFCPHYTWTSGGKKNHGSHLHDCLKKFILSRREPVASTSSATHFDDPVASTSSATPHLGEPAASTSSSTTPPLGEPCLQCEAFYNDPNPRRYHMPAWTEEQRRIIGPFYEPVFEHVPDWLRLPDANDVRNDPDAFPIRGKSFRELELSQQLVLSNDVVFEMRTGLHDVLDWIKRYVIFAPFSTLRFYHLGIRAGSFDSFFAQFSSVRDHVAVLPYWCLCNGSVQTEASPLYRYHRHMLIVTDDQRKFEHAWRCVKFAVPIDKNLKQKFLLPIKDLLHFVHTLQYISRPQSRCSFITDKKDKRTYQHHHCIRRPVVPHAVFWLALLVHDFPQKVFENQAKNKPIGDLATKRHDPKKGWFGLASEYLPTRCVPRFSPLSLRIDKRSPQKVTSVGEFLQLGAWQYVHWLDGTWYRLRKAVEDEHVHRVSEMSTREYARFHVATDGNTLTDLNNAEDVFRLSYRQQRMANRTQKSVRYALERRQGDLREENSRLQEKITRLQGEITELRKQLVTEKERVIQEKEYIIQTLKNKIETLEKTIAFLESRS